MNHYISIKNLADMDTFIKTTNALHDGYIVAVEFQNKGIKPIPSEFASGYEFDWKLRRLKIRVLITSIQDAVLEIVFENVLEWKITEDQTDILEAAVCFDDRGSIVWSDGAIDMDKLERNDSYVIAKKMKWRILK